MKRHSHAVFPALIVIVALVLAGRMMIADVRPVRAQVGADQTLTAYAIAAATLEAGYSAPTAQSGQPAPTTAPAAPAATALNTPTFTPTIVTPGVGSTPTVLRTPGGATTTTPTRSPLPTATPTISGAALCQPGGAFTVAGNAPPRAPLLLYFNGRAVGGGSAGVTGQFALTLTVGRERPGVYPISVRLRGDGREVFRTVCEVTMLPLRLTTPTPHGG